MPEIVIADEYVASVPSFLAPKMPKEFSNEAAPEKAPAEPAPALKETPAALPKEEAKSVAEAATAESISVKEDQQETKDEGKATTGKDQEKATTRRFERRIDRAIRARAEAQTRADLLERENAELRARTAPPTAPGAPKQEDFTDVEEYAKAYAKFETDNALKEREQKQRDERAQAFQHQLEEAWETKVTKAISKYDDFDEVVGDLKPITPWAIALMDEENGEDIAYHLGKHPQEAERIFALHPLAQAREIGKLGFKLSAMPETPKKPSKAPPPIAPVAGTGETGEQNFSEPMPFEKYMKLGDKMFRGR